jgi:hypothetical protein
MRLVTLLLFSEPAAGNASFMVADPAATALSGRGPGLVMGMTLPCVDMR